MNTARSAADIAALAQLACLLEVSAPKPGNVSPGRHFADLTYEDFLTSAVAIGPAFTRVADQPVGETIRQAIEMTRMLDEDQHESRHRVAARAACQSGDERAEVASCVARCAACSTR